MIVSNYTISFKTLDAPTYIPAVQGDTGRNIVFSLADYTIPTGATATYYVQKPSGEAVYNNATITGNTILVELTAQALAEAGYNKGQVRIEYDEEVITSFEFILDVTPFRGIDAVESSSEANIFDQAVDEASEEFESRASNIAAEVIETIPQDYTELTDDYNQQIADGYLEDLTDEFKFSKSATSTANGVTYTSDTDGTVTINNKATGNSWRGIGADGGITNSPKTVSLIAGVTYKIWFTVVSGSSDKPTFALLRILKKSNTSTVLCTVLAEQAGTVVTYTPTVDVDAYLVIYSIGSTTYSNLKIKPHFMIDNSKCSNTTLNARVTALENDIHISPSMFEKMGVIGDSFSSGVSSESGTAYTYSWLMMMVRQYGCSAGHCFAEGGLTTRTWLTNSNGLTKLQNTEACNVYFIALGINDSNPDSRNVPLGTAADMDTTPHPDTFYGNMATIRDAILTKNEHAVICLITPMRIGDRYTPYQDAVVDMAETWGCLLVDWRDVPYCNDEWWTSHLSNLHPTVPMYDAMMHSIVNLMSKAIEDNLAYMGVYPNIINS